MGKVLPKGWAKATISEMIAVDGAFKDGDWVESKDQDPNGNVRLIQLADVGFDEFRDRSSRFLTSESAQNLNCNFLKKGDILIARMPDPIGRACIFPLEGKNVTVVDIAFIRAGTKGVNSKLLMHFINSPAIKNQIENLASGTTRQRISRKNLGAIIFPVPPLEEQQRIVAKLDSFFGHLENVKTRLGNVPQLLKNFRQAILAQAVTGKLTEEWREGKDLAIDVKIITEFSNKIIDSKYNENGWLKTNIDSISSRVSVGHVGKTSEFYTDDTGIPFIRSQNVKPGKVVLDKIAYITREFHEKLKKSQLLGGELLIVRVGANRGDATVLPHGLGEINCANIVFARVKPEFSNYLDLLFQSNKWLNVIDELSTGTAQGVINTKVVAKVEVSLPSIEEQTEINRRVASLFDKINAIEVKYNKLKEQIESLPRAILAKAFKGELVAQLPTDGDAKELLEEIRKMKEIENKKPKSKKIKTKTIRKKPVKKEHSDFPLHSILIEFEEGLSKNQLYAKSNLPQHNFLIQLNNELNSSHIEETSKDGIIYYIKAK